MSCVSSYQQNSWYRNAERAWGAVKQLKSGRRGHLSGPNTKKQATIFAKACIDEATLKRKNSIKDADANYNTWTDEDDAFVSSVGIFGKKKVEEEMKRPIFKYWDRMSEEKRPSEQSKVRKEI